jgi:hypothetical protein
MQRLLERGSAARTAVPEAWMGILGAGARVPGSEARVTEVDTKPVLLGAKCCHLAGEVLEKCGVVGGVPTLASTG